MKKILLSALFALFMVPTLAGAATFYVDASAIGTADGSSLENAFININDAIANPALLDGDTILISGGTYESESQLTLTKGVTVTGNGTTLKAVGAFSTTNGSKNLFLITSEAEVTISDITFDCDAKCYGVQAYGNAHALLNNVTIMNSKGAGLTVNGSTITANNLTTSGNAWGAVNVDPGSGVTTPSVFTLNNGTLSENNQIWSDGAKVSDSATVTVNATGYSQYFKAGETKPFFFWKNILTNAVTITNGATTTLYATIQSAITGAQSGDTINVAPGTYTEQVSIEKNLTLTGADKATTIIKAPTTIVNGSLGKKSIVEIGNESVVTVSGLTVTGPGSAGCASIDYGFYVAGSSTLALSNSNVIDIKDTPFSGCQNGNAIRVGSQALLQSGTATIDNVTITSYQKGGIVVDGVGSSATITNNTITGVGATPSIAQNGIQISRGATGTVTNNIVSGNSYTGGTGTCSGDGSTLSGSTLVDYLNACDVSTGILFYQQGSGITVTGNTVRTSQLGVALVGGSAVVLKNNNLSGNVRDLDTDVAIDATLNFWGTTTNPAEDESLATSTLATYSPWYSDSSMAMLASTVKESETTVGNMKVAIPEGVTVTGPSTWDGTIDAPTVTTATVTIAGFTTAVTSAIAIGSSNSDLTFDKAVKLTFAGQADKHVGWINTAGTFAEITSTCSANDQTAGDTLSPGTDCKINAGADLVVWTKHFTTFTTYTQTAVPTTPAGNGGGYFVVTNTPASPTAVVATGLVSQGTTGQVLGTAVSSQKPGKAKGEVKGAVTFNFLNNLRFGMIGDDVTELQKLLITGGYLKLSATTKYFGPLTRTALIKWQAKNNLPATGFFGPLSRALVLN